MYLFRSIRSILRVSSKNSCKILQIEKNKYVTLSKFLNYEENAQKLETSFSAVRFYCTDKLVVTRNLEIENEEDYQPDFDEIGNGDPETIYNLKVIALEVSVLRQEGKCVPPNTFLRDEHWLELLKLKSRSARMKYLQFLFKNLKKKENRQIKKEKRRAEHKSYLGEKTVPTTFEEFVGNYNLGYNNMFLRFYDTTINNLYNYRLIQAIMYGQKIVVDCGYNSNMTSRENRNCAKQIMLLFSDNRLHDDPFDVHLCNADKGSYMMQSLHKYITTMYEPWFPLNVNEKSYLDAFPKENLVYLTPHCREEMEEYDHDAVYIIGGIVDKVNCEPLSLAKAKKEGIKMLKFPLDRYLQWVAGSGKSLTLNQVLLVLLDMKKTGDWKYALRHVPRRKLMDDNVEKFQRIQRSNNVKKFWPLKYNSNTGARRTSDKFNTTSGNISNKEAFIKAREKRNITRIKHLFED